MENNTNKVKRIIPCMDIKDGRIVKGVKFEGLRDVASPIEMAKYYNESGADELVFYDIAASVEGRGIFAELLKEVASLVTIPLTAGGGIATIEDFGQAIECGASKVSINSGAIANPDLIRQASEKYGKEAVVMAMDVKRVDGQFRVFKGAGLVDTGLDAIEWALKGEALGAGELVANSIDTDGVKQGFDIELLSLLKSKIKIPVVASGGAGSMEDFYEVFVKTDVETALGASVFHFKEIEIMELKKYLQSKGINVVL